MRHLCVLLLFVLGLSVCWAGWCYEKESYRSCSWFWNRIRCSTKYRRVRKCCRGYYGSNCDRTECSVTEYYTGTCCRPRNPNGPCADGPCIEKRQANYCYSCTRRRTNLDDCRH